MTEITRRHLAVGIASLAAAPVLADTPKRVEDGAFDVVEWNNHVYRIHIRSEDTGGGVGALIAEFPYLEAPPLHRHNDADELFHVLSGEMVLMVDGVRQTVMAGQTAVAPRGKPHSFIVTSEDGASIFTVFTPGGFEGFFGAVEGLNIPQDMGRIKEIGATFDLDILGPPMRLDG